MKAINRTWGCHTPQCGKINATPLLVQISKQG